MNTDTLMGGRKVAAMFEDGSTRELTVRQLAVRDYPAAFPKTDNEIALVAFVCGITDEEAGRLKPECYERLQALVQEVNAGGFFAWSARQLERARRQIEAMSPDMLKLAMERGLGLPKPSPGSAPRRA